MGFRSLQACVEALRRESAAGPAARRQLVTIDHPVDPHLEIAEVQRRLFRAAGPAVQHAAWDASASDLTRYKLSSREQIERKLASVSKHNAFGVAQLRRKLGDVQGAWLGGGVVG